MFKAVVISLVAGGFATSLAEYLLRYNLIDLIVEKVTGLFKSEEAKVRSDLKKL